MIFRPDWGVARLQVDSHAFIRADQTYLLATTTLEQVWGEYMSSHLELGDLVIHRPFHLLTSTSLPLNSNFEGEDHECVVHSLHKGSYDISPGFRQFILGVEDPFFWCDWLMKYQLIMPIGQSLADHGTHKGTFLWIWVPFSCLRPPFTTNCHIAQLYND